jgi:hypothetical protein
MVAVPIKPEFGPTLGRLLSPRWRAVSPFARGVAIAAIVGLLALIMTAALALQNAGFSHAGKVPFSFSYRSLYRVASDPGGYVKVQRRGHAGVLKDSFAVEPLRLPAYSGGLSGELALYATDYIRALSRRYSGFTLSGEGSTKVNAVPAYNVMYSAIVDGRSMYGRDVLLLPERPGARDGVDIVMLTAPRANAGVKSPLEVATTGVLARPLKTFTLG